ncbi:MAG: hypothetical protein JWR22_2203 [Herminiimonas sp.]|nr:hypothetical protein [Herminiimonas sp.]
MACACRRERQHGELMVQGPARDDKFGPKSIASRMARRLVPMWEGYELLAEYDSLCQRQ